MGNLSSSSRRRRHRNHPERPPTPPPLTLPQPQPEISANQYVFAAATPYLNPDPPPPRYYQFPGYYPAPPPPPPYDHHHHYHHHGGWAGGRFPYGTATPPPYIEHQKAVTIRNEINLKKETLRLEADEDNPGRSLVSFAFDATVAGSITVMFFAEEDEDLTATREDVFPSVTVNFQEGLGQTFKQPSVTGVDLSVVPESDLLNEENETDVYPLAVKAEALSSVDQNGSEENPSVSGTVNCQITYAVFEKEKGEFKVRVVKQILWVNGKKYVLQEIYGIGKSVDDKGVDVDESGKECVICLSEPRDTTVLPCRHMCMCSGCAKVLRFQTNRCPICRQPVEKLLEIKVNNNGGDD